MASQLCYTETAVFAFVHCFVEVLVYVAAFPGSVLLYCFHVRCII